MYFRKPALFFKHFPNCTFEEFHAATGSGKQTWYDKRYAHKKASFIKPHPKRMKKETRFVIENPNATFEEFQKAIGGDRESYRAARSAATSYFDYHKMENPIVFMRKRKVKEPVQASFEFKQEPEKNLFEDAVEIVQSVGRKEEPLKNPQPWDEVKRDFEIKEEHVSLGITPDFIWYESTQMRNDLNYAVSKNMNRFEHLVKVMEARHADNQKMLNDLMDQVKDLKAQNSALMSNRYTKD